MRLVVRRFAVLLLAATALAAGARSAAAGTDLDVFIAGTAVQPNVLIIFDNSGSMNENLPYDPAVTYPGSYATGTVYSRCRTFNANCTCNRTQTTWVVQTHACGFVDENNDGNDDRSPSYVKIGNRRNYETSGNVSRLAVAKSVIDGLLRDPANDEVRFGLMVLNGDVTLACGNPATAYHNDRTILKAEIGTSHSTLRTIVNGLTAQSGTPLANRLIAGARYFANDGYFTGVADPIQYWCQRNFVLLMTDGRPQGEGNNTTADLAGQFNYIESWFGGAAAADYTGDGRDPDAAHLNPPAGCLLAKFCTHDQYSNDEEPCEYVNGGSDYLDDVAKKILDEDLRPDLENQQSIVTYTIGYTVENSLLSRTAQHGGGQYYTANTADELAHAFRKALRAIVGETESFVAPVVPVSQTTRTLSGDRLYIALFRPREGHLRWPGNLKKYRVSDTGQLLDADGNPATAADGKILDGARSFWDAAPSGPNVNRGGVGELLVNRATARQIYTNLSGADLTAAANAFATANADITAATLDVPDTAKRDQVINYVHGVDVFDDDEDDNFTEKRDWILGDIVHSVPLVVPYGNGDAAILIGSNGGMLHAFDDATGEELWAFVPDVLLPQLKRLLPGESGAHPYYVDSSAKLHRLADGRKIVVFGLGRGGRAYYALDVTNKTAPQFLWRVTHETVGMGELGQSWSEPAFVKVNAGGSTVDALIVGAGYDEWFDDPTNMTANGSGMGRGVFVLNAETGALVSHLRPSGMNYAVPSNVAVLDLTGDGFLDRAYVGDLGGQMWRIDQSLTATRLFSAPSDPGTALYKIFYPPDVLRDFGFLSVFFGTGDRSNPLSTAIEDRIYHVKDDGTSNLTEDDLVDVTDQVEQNGSDAEAELKETLKLAKGWFIVLNERPGEKVLASPTAFFSVFFTTFTPLEGACNAGGDARLYELNYATGGIPDRNVEDPDDDDPDAPTVGRDGRFVDLGKSIPTELTVTIQREGASGFVASSGEVDQIDLPGLPQNVTPISWFEWSTAVPD
jgi:type IV pilus assembly protein PilY1